MPGMAELMDGAMQQAEQRGRQGISGSRLGMGFNGQKT